LVYIVEEGGGRGGGKRGKRERKRLKNGIKYPYDQY